MSDVRGMVDHVTGVLPDGLGPRIRWLFAAFALLVAPLSALGLTAVEVPGPQRVLALLALVVIGAWAWAQYRQDGLAWWADPVPIVGILVAGWAMGTPRSVFGLMFVLLYGRALYGSGTRVWLNVAGFYVAYETAKGLTGGVAAVMDISLVTTGLGVVFSAGVMRMLAEVIRSHEDSTEREEVLARAASRLQRAPVHDEVYEVAVEAALELFDAVPDAAVTLWRGDAKTLRMETQGGDVADDVPLEVPLETLQEDMRRALLAGEPFVLDEAASASVQRSVQMDRTFASILIAPLTAGSSFSGALAIASRDALEAGLVSSLGRLATDVGRALDRADSTVLLRRVVDNSSDAIVLVDGDLVVDFASRATASLLGYEPAELTGQTIAELFAESPAGVLSNLESAATVSERRAPEVLAMRHRDGTTRQIELAATRLSDTLRRGWVINLRDVTERTRVERALRDSELRFRSLAENVTEGLYRMTLGLDPRFEYVNPAMEQMCGFPAQRFIDDPELTLRQVHPDDRELIERTRYEPDDVRWPVEVRWRRPSGEWMWVSFREAVIHDADGVPVSSMGILSDITARKQQEEALRNALDKERHVTEELRRVDSMRTTFIQAVSHELRTPLTAITGYAQTLNRGAERLDEPTRARLLERLEVNAGKLDRLLADLLDVDRLSSHALEPIRRSVDVADLCRRVIDQIDGRTHPITCTSGPAVAQLDASKVERIVENLVRNAMKYSEPGTPVVVDVEPDDTHDGTVLTVRDHGPGVPADLADSIFEPFVQGQGSASSAQPGTGIGLTLVARFAEMHGGRAWVEHPSDGGAAFHVWLPNAPTETAEITSRDLTGRAARRRTLRRRAGGPDRQQDGAQVAHDGARSWEPTVIRSDTSG